MATHKFKNLGTGWGGLSVVNNGRTLEVSEGTGAAVAALPLIAGPQAEGDTATVDTSQLTNVTSTQWRIVGGADLGTASTQVLPAASGQVEVVTVSDEGTLISPKLRVYAPMADPSHNAMDARAIALVPHNTMTKIAAASGNWSASATWVGGNIPQTGDRVLIPVGVSVLYDVDAPTAEIDALRVDGTLSFATDTNTHLHVNDWVGDRMSVINIGNGINDRIKNNVQATVTFNGSTPFDLTRDEEIMGRGLVTMGTLNIFGAEKLNHSRAAFGVPAASTNIVLEKTPTGWVTGDEIIIGATSAILPVGLGVGMHDVAQDEIVTITSVSGNTVNFTPALTYSHENQSAFVDRTDIRPMVQLRANSRNVILQSEVTTPVTQRSHIMVMHMYGRLDARDVGLIELGRTNKSESTPIGVLNSDGLFQFHDGTAMQTTAMTADANMRGRYALHGHVVGYSHLANGRPMPLMQNVTIEGSPGWGGVHHDCEMHMISSSTFRVFGCGFVAEQGGELGVWDDLSAMQSTAVNMRGSDIFLHKSPKGQHNDAALAGDFFNYGYGFGYRGRSVKMTRCIATSCSWGHVFYHRAYANDVDMLFPTSRPPRDRMDLKEVGLFHSPTVVNAGEWRTNDYPIIHLADCGAIACLSGIFVTKQGPNQSHDFNVIWKGFFSHGFRHIGMEIEYVGTYILQDIDCVAGAQRSGDTVGQQGIVLKTQTYQISIVRPRTEGVANNGIQIYSSTVNPFPVTMGDDFDATTDPRFWVIGHESVNDGTEFQYVGSDNALKTFDQIGIRDSDFDLSYIDYSLIPTHTFPDIIGDWDGTSTANITRDPVNTDGLKFGNHPVGLPIAEKTWEDGPFPTSTGESNDRARLAQAAVYSGYSQVGADHVLIQRDILSDVLSGRPAKFTWLWKAAVEPTFTTDNGPASMSAAVTAPDVLLVVPVGGSVTFNALTGAAGGSGSFEIDPGDYVAPDYGEFDINYATGDVTYTPREGVSGQSDFGYISVRSVQDTGATKTETRSYATKRVSFIVTDSDTMLAPVVGTDITVAGGVGVIDFDLLQRPDTGGRRLLAFQYSTDGGTTFRRLCNGYLVTSITVDVDSAGNALTADSYNVRLRYFTDHEYGFSPETANIATTVT